MLAQGLHSIFERISATGQVPQQWRAAVLVPIYKDKGDMADVSNYRPLSVPTISCRIWSSLTNKRLMEATKDILPDTMFGFRPKRGCSDPLFVLRHLMDMRKAKKGAKFAVAFMDLSGAYDSIDRNLLFAKLTQMGMSAHSIQMLQSLYTNTTCTVKCDQGISHPFAVTCGLRQGCPLSTTLFNLFIWDLHNHILQQCPGSGVKLHHKSPAEEVASSVGGAAYTLITDLGYADDISLLGSSPTELQCIIDCFVGYCDTHGLIINPQKCEVVVFAGRCNTWANSSWTAGDHVLARVDKFKYLGVELHGTQGIAAALRQRLTSMVRAQSAINRRLRQMHMARDPTLIADLFDIITGPAGSYGCEVWGTPYLNAWHTHDCILQRYQASVYKHALGVKRCTSNLLAFFESGKYPMQLQWLSRTVKYWNKLVGNKASSDLLMCTITNNVQHSIADGHLGWSNDLLAGLLFVAPDHDWKADMLALKPIMDPKSIVERGKGMFCQSIKDFDYDPTDPACTTRQRSTYYSYMLARPWQANPADDRLQTPAYLHRQASVRKKQAVAKYRLGGAPIRANIEHAQPYLERICQRCVPGNVAIPPSVDNEPHMLFDCSHSKLMTARSHHHQLFEGVSGVHKFMEAAYNPNVAGQLIECISDMMKGLEHDV